jgi:hypothetical protein
MICRILTITASIIAIAIHCKLIFDFHQEEKHYKKMKKLPREVRIEIGKATYQEWKSRNA